MRIPEPAVSPSNGYVVAVASLSAACLVAAGVAVALTSGVSQEIFQTVRPPAEYAASLVDSGRWLRVVYGIDGLFIGAYTVSFVFVAKICAREGNRLVTYLALACLLATGILDLAENYTAMTMLVAAENHVSLSAGQIELALVVTQLKFHLSYVGVMLLGFVLPRESVVERLLCLSLVAVQMPVGLAAAITALPALAMARSAFFFIGFTAVAWIFWTRTRAAARS